MLVILSLFLAVATAREGFYDPTQLPDKPARLDRALAATVRLNGCSGLILSPDGIVATNIHCILGCLDPRWDYSPDIHQDHLQAKGLYEIRRFYEPGAPRLQCSPYILDQLTIYEYQLTQPRILWIGRGMLTHNEEKVAQVPASVRQLMRDSTEDVAILEFKKHPTATPNRLPCVRPSTSAPRAGDRLWVIGWPAYAKRPNGLSSSGAQQKVSMGSVRATVADDPVYRAYAALMPVSMRLDFWAFETSLWQQPHLLMTDADIYHGNSGGVMLDSRGEAAAITFSVSRSSDSQYEGATGFGFRTDALMNRVAEDLGADAAARIFNCGSETEI